tara:strand:- start:30 stop:389 length:360 start_codon:yes stop_codon:yes gene_type:complete
MALKITLSHPVKNTSLQVGDVLYSTLPTARENTETNFVFNSSPGVTQTIGVIDAIGYDYIIVLDQQGVPGENHFLMFQKSKAANNTSLIGYYAELQFKNNSSEHIELFSVGAEVAPSSK